MRQKNSLLISWILYGRVEGRSVESDWPVSAQEAGHVLGVSGGLIGLRLSWLYQ